MKIIDLLQDLYYNLKYDIFKFPLKIPENFDEKKILNQKIKISSFKDGGLMAESMDFPNLYASGNNLEELREAYYDTILTYFDIPRYFSKRRIDNFKLTLDDGTEIQAKTYASHYELAGA